MSAEPEPDALSDPQDKLILIVDDEDSQRELMVHIARKEGFRVDEAKSGAEVLHKVVTASPDLIMLDLMLPGRGGYEVLRELQAGGEGGVPVIVVTARSMDRKTIEAITLESNVRDFIPKPLNPEVVGAALHATLKTRPRPLAKKPS